jgi:hypothetical protein
MPKNYMDCKGTTREQFNVAVSLALYIHGSYVEYYTIDPSGVISFFTENPGNGIRLPHDMGIPSVSQFAWIYFLNAGFYNPGKDTFAVMTTHDGISMYMIANSAD